MTKPDKSTMNPFPPELVETLLNMSESSTLDFKRDQYPLTGANDEQKGELIKDILAFANAWKTSDAHIVIGVDENPGQRATVVGVADHPNDATLQQLVNSKTNKPINFEYAALTIDGKSIGIIRISNSQQRPLFLKKKFGRLQAGVVYMRRGSSTTDADPDEIARMGAANVTVNQPAPQIDLQFGDPTERQLFGAMAIVTSKILRNRSAHFDFEGKKNDSSGYIALPHMMSGFNDVDPKKLEAYRSERALLDSLGFYAKNTGRILIEDARVVVEIPKHKGLRVFDQEGLPVRPRGVLDAIASMRTSHSHSSDTWVQTNSQSWEVFARLGKIQPNATVWSDSFYIGSTTPIDISLVARIFGDNISQPIDVPFAINIKTEDHLYNEDYDSDSGEEGDDAEDEK